MIHTGTVHIRIIRVLRITILKLIWILGRLEQVRIHRRLSIYVQLLLRLSGVRYDWHADSDHARVLA